MDTSRQSRVSKNMFNTGRRSAISSSELGLYSDHSDRYNTNIYSTTVRKLVIGIMVVVSVVLIGIFLYDFASSASISSKVSQETKHIYILQNSLRKSSGSATKRTGVTLAPTIYIVNSSHASVLEDRSDDERNLEYQEDPAKNPTTETRTQRMAVDEPELRIQNLKNFKIRRSMLDRQHNEDDASAQEKQMMDNHAMIYRVSKQMQATRVKFPGSTGIEDTSSDDESQRATPFRFELKGPHPASFKRPKYPQLTQYRYPHTSRNIQDIIKYLTNDPETLNRGIKFTGFYVNPKKYDTGLTDIGEVAMNSDRSEEQESAPYAIAFNADPLYQYKPKHPADVNLLATSNFRFSPVGVQRYNPYFDPYYQRPNANKQSVYQENQYDSAGTYVTTTNYRKRRKPKPFSVMLDIYPITDTAEQTKKSSRFKPAATVIDESDARRPLIPFFSRPSKAYGMYTQSPHAVSMMPIQQQQPAPDEEEKHQMILHLNLYPKRKNKLTRNDVIERSEMMPTSEKEQLIDRMILPFDAITKHLTDHAAVEEAKLSESYEELGDTSKVRYEETSLAKEDLGPIRNINDNDGVQIEAEKLIATTAEVLADCNENCEMTTTTPETTTFATTSTTTTYTTTVQSTTLKSEDSTIIKDIDTVEGFQKFADSLIATD